MYGVTLDIPESFVHSLKQTSFLLRDLSLYEINSIRGWNARLLCGGHNHYDTENTAGACVQAPTPQDLVGKKRHIRTVRSRHGGTDG